MVELISRYRAREESLQQFNRGLGADVGGVDKLASLIIEFIEDVYLLKHVQVLSIVIPRIIARVEADKQFYYLKIRDEQPEIAMDYVQSLVDSGFLTAEVVPTGNGENIASFTGRYAYLLREVQGECISESAPDLVAAGKHLARLHGLSLSVQSPSQSVNGCKVSFEFLKGLPRCWIHGDYKLAHLFKSRGRIATIDFDEVCIMERLYDLWFFCAVPDTNISRNPSFGGQQIFIDAYQSATNLTAPEREILPRLLLSANERRVATLLEWQSRGLEISTELLALANCTLDEARKAVG